MSASVRALAGDERPWVAERLRERWGSELVAGRGRVRDASALLGFVAEEGGERIGLATYEIRGEECELVTLDSYRERIGAGSALVVAVANAGYEQGCRRLVVVTTNDNLLALGFYQRRGFGLVALRAGAVDTARQELKPEIPELGQSGIPIHDELELSLSLTFALVGPRNSRRTFTPEGPAQS
jgi:N-acetylglutamate synthase-like GNAT family acetyltransferase